MVQGHLIHYVPFFFFKKKEKHKQKPSRPQKLNNKKYLDESQKSYSLNAQPLHFENKIFTISLVLIILMLHYFLNSFF